MSKYITILGGGIAGLAAAYYAKKMNDTAVVYEAKNEPGGLLANFMIGDFRFDNAVHFSFAKEPEVREVFDQAPYYKHPPESLNWDLKYWLRHPVQNNLYPLSVNERVELIQSLVDQEPIELVNYENWLVSQYGTKISHRWPERYTRKYWRVEAKDLGVKWVGSRMRKADLSEVLKGAMSEEKENHFYTKEMRYPKEGGFFSFIKPLVKESTIEYNQKAIEVDLDNKRVTFESGTVVDFDELVSTIPLPELVSIIPNAPATVRAAAKTLFATAVDLISVGFDKPNVSPSLWFYIYDEDIEAARAYSPSWKSPANAPEGKSSLQFEIYSRPGDPADRDPKYLIENTRKAIKTLGLATDDEILFMKHKRLPYGNVVFMQGMEEERQVILDWLEDYDITLAGRFGAWDYYWTNQSFMSGKSAAESIHNKQSKANN